MAFLCFTPLATFSPFISVTSKCLSSKLKLLDLTFKNSCSYSKHFTSFQSVYFISKTALKPPFCAKHAIV
eukprot:UN08344